METYSLIISAIPKKGESIMAENTVAFNCPNCGAELAFDADKQKLCCEFCLSEFTEDEFSKSDTNLNNQEFCEHMQEYSCPNCGAEFLTDEETAAGICTYCHSPVVLKGKLSGQMKPDKVIPFKYGKEEAEKKFFDFIKRKRFLPSDFKSRSHADKIAGVYYPFWVTDADTSAHLNASCARVRVWRTGDTEYTETTKYNVRRAGEIHFEDIVTSAISNEDKEMLEGILPYPSDSLEDFTMPYLSGFTAKKRNIDTHSVTEEVKSRMNSYSETLLRNTVHGYNTTNVLSNQVKINRIRWDYTLMPIWVLNYKTKGKTYTYAMNGFTGKIYGKLPLSIKKLFAASAGLFAAIFAAVTLIGGIGGGVFF